MATIAAHPEHRQAPRRPYRVIRPAPLRPGWPAQLTGADVARIVDELTRRGFLAGGASAAALAGLAACGSDHPATTTATGTAGNGSRSVATAKGKVSVPAAPRRVIAIAPQARGTLYDLGVTPVGVYDEGAQYISPRYRAKVASAATVGTAGQLNLEKIAGLDPDLIIGADFAWNTGDYAQLTKIAPTVITPATSWQAIARSTADAVNRNAALQALDKTFTAKAAAIRAQHAAVLARYRWDILQGGFEAGKFWLYGTKSDVGAILASAGVRFASASAGAAGNGPTPTSYEKIDVLDDADVIGFYASFDGTPNNEGPQLFAQPAFTALPPVRAARTVPIADFLPAGYGDAIALLGEVEAGLKKLEESQ